MEFENQKELYIALLPVFNVKRRLNSITKYPNTRNRDIWYYLVENKWRHSKGLTISDMVNDIILLDINDVNKNGGQI